MRIKIGSVPGVMRRLYIEMPGAFLTVFEYLPYDLNAFGTCYNALLLGMLFKKEVYNTDLDPFSYLDLQV